MRPEDVYALDERGDPRLSPDGRASRTSSPGSTARRASTAARSGSRRLDGSAEPRQFTSGEKRDGSPRWSPDGRWLAFTSNRAATTRRRKAQLYVMPPNGGEPRKLTDGEEASRRSPGRPTRARIAFARRVRDEAYEEEDDRKRAPRRFTRVFYKLDSVGWTGDRRTHLFVVDVEGDGEPGSSRRRLRARRPRVVSRRQADRVRRRCAASAGTSSSIDAPLRPRRRRRRASRAAHAPTTTPTSRPSFSPDGTRIAFHFTVEDGTYPAPRPDRRSCGRTAATPRS